MEQPEYDGEELRARAVILAESRRRQDGVVSWAQLRDGGWSAVRVEKAVRRRELVHVHPRVYVDHTGPLTWRQRAWAAVLWAEPAALCDVSMTERSPLSDAPIHVAVDHRRRLRAVPSGVVLHRLVGLSRHLGPADGLPRLIRADNALMMTRSASDDAEVVAVLAAAASSGVTADQLSRALARFPQLPRRSFIAAVVADVTAGSYSVLEHAYLTRVERAHGLPTAPRQVQRGVEYRDLEYDVGLVVELDGRLNHESWSAQARDAERDLDDAASGRTVVRLRWRQVVGTPCRTAERIARILTLRGWDGRLRACGPFCEARV